LISKRKTITGHRLYYFSTCPYCIFVRLALLWWGLKIPLREIMFNAQNNADLIAGGGKNQVPCLRIETGNGDVRWLYESIDIVRYLKSHLVKQTTGTESGSR
jgi:glutathione S-transferase